jgi:hypothetical protein
MIRSITVIGHGVDLIPHFIDHYESQVDRIGFIVYETDDTQGLFDAVTDAIRGKSNVEILKRVHDRVFDWERVTTLYNELISGSVNDWWVVADIDEFHLYPGDDLRSLLKDCSLNGWSILRGGFIDRVGKFGDFPKLVGETNIFAQYPNAGFFRYPLSGACPNKICVVKGNVQISNGQHYAIIGGHTTWRWQGWNHPMIAPTSTHSVQVHHFKWDSTCIDRIRAVADINKPYAYSSEYRLMYDALSSTGFRINLADPRFMFEMNYGTPGYIKYKNWKSLINLISSI